MRAQTVQRTETIAVGKSIIGWVLGICLAYLAFGTQIGGLTFLHQLISPSLLDAIQASATTIPLDSITLGAVIQINGQNFVKIGDNRYLSVCAIESNKCLVEGQQWDETTGKCVCVSAISTAQKWTGCDSLTAWQPGTSEASNDNTVCLVDSSDNSLYEVHRHASDNKCWATKSIDNSLEYLGALQCKGIACAGGQYCDNDTLTCKCTPGSTWDSNMNGCIVTNACSNPTAWMQDWTGCSALTAWSATDTSGQTACLADQRDGKTYMVRKLPDNRCWMVNNLAYGASDKYGFDVCANRTTMTSAGSEAAIKDKFGGQDNSTTAYGLWGDCRGNSGVADSYRDGYYYNWAAAMQQTNTWNGSSNQPANQTNVQGLCPDGWVLPTGGTGATTDSQKLASAVNGTYATSYNDATTKTFFQNSSYGWHGLYSGGTSNTGGLDGQGSSANYWSSTFNDASRAYSLVFDSSYIYPESDSSKNIAHSIRCLKQ